MAGFHIMPHDTHKAKACIRTCLADPMVQAGAAKLTDVKAKQLWREVMAIAADDDFLN
jgi:hypothetical protein